MRLNQLRKIIVTEVRRSLHEVENNFDEKVIKLEGFAIFDAAFGKKQLGTRKFKFEKTEHFKNDQYQLWINTNPTEFITADRMKTGNYKQISDSDEEVMMKNLLDKLKKKLIQKWSAVVRQLSNGTWYIILVKDISN